MKGLHVSTHDQPCHVCRNRVCEVGAEFISSNGDGDGRRFLKKNVSRLIKSQIRIEMRIPEKDLRTGLEGGG